MAILSCHVSIKLPPKISDGQENQAGNAAGEGVPLVVFRIREFWGDGLCNTVETSGLTPPLNLIASSLILRNLDDMDGSVT